MGYLHDSWKLVQKLFEPDNLLLYYIQKVANLDTFLVLSDWFLTYWFLRKNLINSKNILLYSKLEYLRN